MSHAVTFGPNVGDRTDEFDCSTQVLLPTAVLDNKEEGRNIS